MTATKRAASTSIAGIGMTDNGRSRKLTNVGGAKDEQQQRASRGREQPSKSTNSEATSAPASSSGADGVASNGDGRLDKTTVCLPIVYGSMAFCLGKKADEYSSHRWTLFLRGPNDEDLSVCIAKAIFQLHPSFSQPVRELTNPPFEVTEKGWGEFEAQIQIFWKDPKEKITLLTHGIKLYPPGASNINPASNKTDPVVAENYDEVVFTDPNETFYRQLMRTSAVPRVQSAEQSVQAHFKKYSDEDDFQKLVEAQKFLEADLQAVKERMMMATEGLAEVEEALREVQEAKKLSTSSRKSKAASSGGNAAKKSKANQ